MMAGCNSVIDRLPHFLKPYRPDVQQGNVITSDMVEQLRPGMSRDQVKFMLGTPLLTDGFHPDRWDYLYFLNPRFGSPQRRNLVIYFKDNRLDSFKSDPMPPESMADNLILGRKTPLPPPSAPSKESPAPAGEATKEAAPSTRESPKEATPEATPTASEPPKEAAPQTMPPAGEPPKEAAPQAMPPAGEPPAEPAPAEPERQPTPPASSQ
ncbi:MAG TPA: outer membrane protein assembly factor BamE [Burkholderiaceae bacterium]